MADSLFYRFQTAPNNGWSQIETLDLSSVYQIVAATNLDNRLEIFFIASDFHVWHVTQTAANASSDYSSKKPLNITARQLAVARNSDGRLELFYIGMDHNIYHNWQDHPGSDNWPGAALGGAAKQIKLGQNADGRLELFYVGLDNNIYHNWQAAPSSGPWPGAIFRGQAKRLTLVPNADNRLELVYIGMDNGLYHNWQNSPNSGDWGGGVSGAQAAGLGGYGKDVTAIRNRDGRIEIFYIGTDDGIYHNWQVAPNGDWHGEVGLGGKAQQLCPAIDGDGRLELFYVGMDGNGWQLWQTSVNGAWTGGATGFLADSFAATTAVDQRIVLVFQGSLASATGTAPAAGALGNSVNYLMYNHGRPILTPSVSLTVNKDITYSSDGPPQSGFAQVYGFSLQLNAYAMNGQAAVWQQYTIGFDGQNLYWQINNWNKAPTPANPNQLAYFVNQIGTMCAMPGGRVAAGWNLTMTLITDNDARVSGARFVATDPSGKTQADTIQGLATLGVADANICPIITYEVDLVGPGNGENVVFNGGSATLHYSSPTACVAEFNMPPGVAWAGGTGENTNSTYGLVPAAGAFDISQSVDTSGIAPKAVVPRNRPTMALPVHRRPPA